MCHQFPSSVGNKWRVRVSEIWTVLSQSKDQYYQVFFLYQWPMQGQRESCGLAACTTAGQRNSKFNRSELHVDTGGITLDYNFLESISPQLRRSPIKLSSCQVYRQRCKFLHDYRTVKSYLVNGFNCKVGSGGTIEYYCKEIFEGRENQGKPYSDRGYL